MEVESLCISGSVDSVRVLCSLVEEVVVETTFLAHKSVIWLLLLVCSASSFLVCAFLICDSEFFLYYYWIMRVFCLMCGSPNVRVFWHCCSLGGCPLFGYSKNREKGKKTPTMDRSCFAWFGGNPNVLFPFSASDFLSDQPVDKPP